MRLSRPYLTCALLTKLFTSSAVLAAEEGAVVPESAETPAPKTDAVEQSQGAAPAAQSEAAVAQALPPAHEAAPSDEPAATDAEEEGTAAPAAAGSADAVSGEPESTASGKEPEEKPDETGPQDGPGTLLGGSDGKVAFGGYGGPSVLGSWFNGQAALLLGMEGGLLVDHRLVLGLAGYGIASEVNGPNFPNGNPSALGLGYGGFMARYQFVQKSPIYPSLGLLVGGGAVTLLEKVGANHYQWDEDEANVDFFFVVEPSLQIHANFTRWMRFSLHGSYRFVSGVEGYGFDNKDLRGATFGGNLQFGWF